jgi:hypothetical protein
MIGFRPKSTLAFIIALSLTAYYYSISIGKQNLQAASEAILIIAGIPFALFVILSLARNFRSLVR